MHQLSFPFVEKELFFWQREAFFILPLEMHLLEAVSGQSLQFFSRQFFVFFFGSHSQCQGSPERNSHHCRSTLNSKFHCSPYRRSNAYLVGPQIKFAKTVALPEMLYRSNGAFWLNIFIWICMRLRVCVCVGEHLEGALLTCTRVHVQVYMHRCVKCAGVTSVNTRREVNPE